MQSLSRNIDGWRVSVLKEAQGPKIIFHLNFVDSGRMGPPYVNQAFRIGPFDSEDEAINLLTDTVKCETIIKDRYEKDRQEVLEYDKKNRSASSSSLAQ